MNHPKELIEDIRNGKMVILVDDEDRENEGDLVMAADFISPEAVNFMITEARGLVCLALTAAQVERLKLDQMIPLDKNKSQNKTAFTVSIEAAKGVSTGISPADRAHTIRVASHPNAVASDISVPGHIFPIRAQNGGVLKRAGHTEGSVDLARMAGLNAAAVICEIINPDGSMARVSDLKDFAQKHDLKIGTIVDLIEYRLQTETFVEETTHHSTVDMNDDNVVVKVFKDELEGQEHLAIIKGDIKKGEPTYVRVQAQNTLDELIGGVSDSRQKIETCLNFFSEESPGVLVYLQKDQNLTQQVSNIDRKLPMDIKNYGVGAQILKALGLTQVKLITDSDNTPSTIKAYGIEIVEAVPFSKIATPEMNLTFASQAKTSKVTV